MRKFLLTLAVLCGTVSAWAEVTKFYKPGERLSTLTTGQKVMIYNTAYNGNQDRTGFLTDNGSNFKVVMVKPNASPIFSEKEGVWTIASATQDGSTYTVNIQGTNGYVGFGGETNNAEAQTLLFHEWTSSSKRAGVKSEDATGTVVENANITADHKVWVVTNADQSSTWNGNVGAFTTWSTGHPYAIYSVVEATTVDLESALATAKTNAETELNALKNLSSIYTTVDASITAVNAVTLENNDLETALNLINTLVADVKAEANGKNVKFCNKSISDGRGGRFLGYDNANSRFAAVMSDDDNVVWTLKSDGNGTFKLYNAANNVWLGQPDRPAEAVTTETDAVAYTFIPTAENVVCLVPNGTSKMVHIANDAGANYPVMNYYSTTDAASLWDVTVISNKEVTNESYTTLINSKKSVLDGIITYAKQLQDKYGLVKDGANLEVVINHPSGGDCQPSSNLLDGNNGTYVHSSYASGANEVTYHYIKAHLSEAKQKVFFYLSKRNNNNRPLKVKVYASNSADEFPATPAATLIMTESQDNSIQSYFTEAIDLGAAYEYLKFEVVNTNTNTQYFTLSELYILPVLEETTKNISDLTSTSVFADDADACLTAANAYYSSLKIPELKVEIQEFLTANADKVAETDAKPTLGQYPYDNYAELNQVIDMDNVTFEDLQNAFNAFKKSKNLPVFMITGVKDYVAGKSIYDDGVDAPNFKLSNVYDKTMWWALDMTETTVSVTDEVGIYNVGTGKGFWGAPSIKITETNDNEGTGIADDGVFLFYTTDNTNTPIHYQDDNQVIVRWSSYDAASGSAQKFFYIGNTYDLEQLSEELITAAAELAAINVPNYSFGTSVNNYTEVAKPAFDAAVVKRSEVLAKFSTVDEITTAKALLEAALADVKINLPVDGKFYRLRCTGSGMKYMQYTKKTNENRFDMISGDEGKTANATFCYTNGGLVSYVNPLYINHDSNIASLKMERTTVTFSEATNVTGQYFINVGGRYIYGDGNNSDSGAGTPDNRKGYRWWLEEVNSLPFTFKAAALGFATFNAPVAVELPEGISAYIGELNTKNNTLQMYRLDGNQIPANTAVLLRKEGVTDDTTVDFTIVSNAEEDFDGVTNNLVGTVAAENLDGTKNCYSLQKSNAEEKVGFYSKTTGTKGGFKAWLETEKAVGARAFTIIFDGEDATGIKEALGLENENVEIYDLSGRRLDKPAKGVNIIGGKTVIVR